MNALVRLALVLLPLLSRLPAQTPATSPEKRLAELGVTLPATSAPVANYVPTVRSGALIYLAGHIPRDASGKVIAGKVGRNATLEDANAAARQTALDFDHGPEGQRAVDDFQSQP